jgi:hypothetical protein
VSLRFSSFSLESQYFFADSSAFCIWQTQYSSFYCFNIHFWVVSKLNAANTLVLCDLFSFFWFNSIGTGSTFSGFQFARQTQFFDSSSVIGTPSFHYNLKDLGRHWNQCPLYQLTFL